MCNVSAGSSGVYVRFHLKPRLGSRSARGFTVSAEGKSVPSCLKNPWYPKQVTPALGHKDPWKESRRKELSALKARPETLNLEVVSRLYTQ